MGRESNKYYQAAAEWLDGIVHEAKTNPNPHRRKIAAGYLEHAALEYTPRYPELLGPARMVEHPFYQVKLLTPDPVVYDGIEAVRGFYDMMAHGPIATNQDELLAVGDWGFSSFMKICQFVDGPTAAAMGQQVPDAEGSYVLEIPLGMYWPFDERIRVKGEYVYQTGPAELTQISPDEVLTAEDLNHLVEPYLPQSDEIGSAKALQD